MLLFTLVLSGLIQLFFDSFSVLEYTPAHDLEFLFFVSFYLNIYVHYLLIEASFGKFNSLKSKDVNVLGISGLFLFIISYVSLIFYDILLLYKLIIYFCTAIFLSWILLLVKKRYFLNFNKKAVRRRAKSLFVGRMFVVLIIFALYILGQVSLYYHLLY